MAIAITFLENFSYDFFLQRLPALLYNYEDLPKLRLSFLAIASLDLT